MTILGPRQSGKTTLVRDILTGYQYSNLEDPEIRQFAADDPKAYLAQFKSRVIIDEIQRVPELLSYLQVLVDNEKVNGRFILTGSHQLKLQESITQSLAGRTAILTLLPLSISELLSSGFNSDSFEGYCYKGFLPRVYDQDIRPKTVHSNYYQTYVERDVRQLINLKNLSLFEKFLKLIAGRVGQIFDASSIANEVGVDSKTISHWLSILEASFILFKLPAYFENFGKRVIKSPKYYFMDVGLLTFMLGIKKKEQISRDPLIGNIFENLVVLECFKERYNQGKLANLYYFRDSNGNEVDLVFQNGRELIAIEIKSAVTYSKDQLKGLKKFSEISNKCSKSYLVYNGEDINLSDNTSLINFRNIFRVFEL
ncbi:MAG: ATP-binding protein [Gammaproteobacteria bacterium]|nr:ATP-binding protein [Gammaproteobacteria bacterium]